MPGEVNPNPNNVNIEKVKKEFARKNGNNLKDFTNKEVMLMLHKESMKKHEELAEKFEKHDREGKKNLAMGMEYMVEHDRIIAEIMSVLPEKGFCEKVTNCLELDKDVTLSDKVTTMWHDRRWVKGMIVALIAVSGLTVYDILMRLFS